MYDYMKALQKRFDRQSHPELDKQVEYAQEELRRDMDAAGRKKLLRLLDAQNALLTESTLSYLGFGVTYPRPTWGNMLNGANNSTVIKNFWWRWLFPAIFLAITCICINIVGDTLRDVMDPKSDRDK